MWDIIQFNISGDTYNIGKITDKEKVDKIITKLNKKCDWTQYHIAIEIPQKE